VPPPPPPLLLLLLLLLLLACEVPVDDDAQCIQMYNDKDKTPLSK
jgi:hypothetical protein